MSFMDYKRKYANIYTSIDKIRDAFADLQDSILNKWLQTDKPVTRKDIEFVLEEIAEEIADLIDILSSNYSNLITKNEIVSIITEKIRR